MATKLSFFGSALRRISAKFHRPVPSVNNNIILIQPATVVHNLGVWIDSELSMRDRVSITCRPDMLLSPTSPAVSIRRQLGCVVSAKLVSAFVLSRLDYCNAVLAGLLASIDLLHRYSDSCTQQRDLYST